MYPNPRTGALTLGAISMVGVNGLVFLDANLANFTDGDLAKVLETRRKGPRVFILTRLFAI